MILLVCLLCCAAISATRASHLHRLWARRHGPVLASATSGLSGIFFADADLIKAVRFVTGLRTHPLCIVPVFI